MEGLTTSALILSVAAIGIAVALDAYILAAGAAILNLFINWGLMALVNRAKPRCQATSGYLIPISIAQVIWVAGRSFAFCANHLACFSRNLKARLPEQTNAAIYPS